MSHPSHHWCANPRQLDMDGQGAMHAGACVHAARLGGRRCVVAIPAMGRGGEGPPAQLWQPPTYVDLTINDNEEDDGFFKLSSNVRPGLV